MKTVILYNKSTNLINDEQKIADDDTLAAANRLTAALTALGHKTKLVTVTSSDLQSIKDIKTDVVFNLCEWTGRDYPLGVEVINKLQKHKLCFTGANATSFDWSSNKTKMKMLFARHNIPTPQWIAIKSLNKLPSKKDLEKLGFPQIAKPAWEHCGIGVHSNSIADTFEQSIANITKLISTYNQPVIVERFIEGRELQISVVKNGKLTVLPPAEVIFTRSKKAVYTFDSKWHVKSQDNIFTKIIVPHDLTDSTIAKINKISRRIFNKLNCRGYIRIDMRLDGSKPYVLEVNANPSVDNVYDCAMAISAEELGWSFPKLVDEVLKGALIDAKIN